MVERDLAGRGISDRRVLTAMGSVPRERFVPDGLGRYAYEDNPLPIGEGQTISQPFIVALMSQALELDKEDSVLEIGTGSGYAAAVLAELAGEVWTIERHEDLADSAGGVLAELGYDNVNVICDDGSVGWPAAAPYEGISVTAAAPRVPDALLGQLTEDGRLVAPIGPEFGAQELVRVRRRAGDFVEESLGGVRFVPLVGVQGFPGR